WARRELERLGVPRGIRHATLARLAALTPAAQRLAEAAAVLGGLTSEAGLLAVAELSETHQAIEELLGSRLLTEHDGLVGFRHVLASQAVYENLTGLARRRLHQHAAQMLEKVVPRPHASIAHHLRAAGDLAAWAQAAEHAADAALAL